MLFYIWVVYFTIRSGRAFLVQFCRNLFASIRVRTDWLPMVDEVCADRPVIRIECVAILLRKIGDKTVVCLFVRARMAACCDPVGKGWFIVGAFVSVVASGTLAVTVLVGLVRVVVLVGLGVGVVLGGIGVGVVVLGGVLVVGVLGVFVAVVVCGVVFLVGLVRCGLVGLGLVAVARRVSGVVGLAVGGVVLRLGVSVRAPGGITPMLSVGIDLTGAVCVAGAVASLAGVGGLVRVGGGRVCCRRSTVWLLVATQGVPGRSFLLGVVGASGVPSPPCPVRGVSPWPGVESARDTPCVSPVDMPGSARCGPCAGVDEPPWVPESAPT